MIIIKWTSQKTGALPIYINLFTETSYHLSFADLNKEPSSYRNSGTYDLLFLHRLHPAITLSQHVSFHTAHYVLSAMRLRLMLAASIKLIMVALRIYGLSVSSKGSTFGMLITFWTLRGITQYQYFLYLTAEHYGAVCSSTRLGRTDLSALRVVIVTSFLRDMVPPIYQLENQMSWGREPLSLDVNLRKTTWRTMTTSFLNTWSMSYRKRQNIPFVPSEECLAQANPIRTWQQIAHKLQGRVAVAIFTLERRAVALLHARIWTFGEVANWPIVDATRVPGTGKTRVIGMTVMGCLQDRRKFLLTVETQYAVKVLADRVSKDCTHMSRRQPASIISQGMLSKIRYFTDNPNVNFSFSACFITHSQRCSRRLQS